MDLAFADKVVLITGASGGIGRSLASTFAEEGARVVLQGRSQVDELTRWTADQAWASNALVQVVDVTQPARVSEAMGEAVKHFGRVDVCVANAGVWPKKSALLHEVDEVRIRSTIETNLMGAIWTARAFMECLQTSGPRSDGHGASLTFIGSTAGRFGELGHAEYSVSKAGLNGLVRTLKNEITHIDPYARVNMVEPGWTVTHLVREELNRPGVIESVVGTMPVRQLGRAVDIARAVLMLSSHVTSRHISGEVLTVAGGMEGRALWPSGDVDEDRVRSSLTQIAPIQRDPRRPLVNRRRGSARCLGRRPSLGRGP